MLFISRPKEVTDKRYKAKTSPIAADALHLQIVDQDYYKVNLRLIVYLKIKANLFFFLNCQQQ